MFGMGFTEILIIAVIAILFLGPDKLPGAMVEIAKFFRNTKNAIGSVKETLEDEMHFSDMKKEALAYKNELESATTHVKHAATNLGDTLLEDDEDLGLTKETKKEAPETVTFKKKKKEKKIEDV